MDLGIKGRKAIVCASSRGLGRGCAMALAENGVDVTINGRDEASLAVTAEDIRAQTGVEVLAVAADISTPEGQRKLLGACPAPDILINNNGGPPRSQIKDLDREQILSGLIMNMVTPNNLLPGFFDTDRQRARFAATSKLTGTAVEDLAAARLRAVPVGRFGDPREFGLACAFLCSAEIGYITAQNLLIDGGRYVSSFG